MQDFDVFCLEGVFFLSIPLGVLRQSISSSVSFALTIIGLEVVMRGFLDPAELSGAQTLCAHELLIDVRKCQEHLDVLY